jgi:predicted O-methyltransferase YrrM
MFLGAIRALDNPKIAEIGILNGASIRMWHDYFRNPEIYAFDINESLLEQLAREGTRVGKLDSGDPAQIADAFGKLPSLDLILEDASHRLEHQVTAIRELVKYLKVGGLLIVEDIFRAVPTSYFQEAVDACGCEVEAYLITPEDTLRASPGWENDRVLIVRRLADSI